MYYGYMETYKNPPSSWDDMVAGYMRTVISNNRQALYQSYLQKKKKK